MKGKKISAQVCGLAIAAIVVWLIEQFGKVPVPSPVAVAFGTVAAVIVSLLVPDAEEADE